MNAEVAEEGMRKKSKRGTVGTKFAERWFGKQINAASRSGLVRAVDRECAKVAEDVLAMADDVVQTRDELVAKVRAKYGKGNG